MQGFDLLTIISLVIAVLAILKLRSVLGRRTTDDEARIDRRMRAREAQQRAAAAGEKVVTLPGRERDGPAPAGAPREEERAKAEAKMRDYAAGDEPLRAGLVEINRIDPSFEPENFMSGAKQAYEMIVTAFAEGNRRLLKDLLSTDVFEGFAEAISERDSQGWQVDQSFVGINSARIVEAEVKDGRTGQVTVKFVSQLISATRDQSGEVVAGDPQRIQEVTDIWTFARDLRSRDPNWKLISTQAPG